MHSAARASRHIAIHRFQKVIALPLVGARGSVPLQAGDGVLRVVSQLLIFTRLQHHLVLSRGSFKLIATLIAKSGIVVDNGRRLRGGKFGQRVGIISGDITLVYLRHEVVSRMCLAERKKKCANQRQAEMLLAKGELGFLAKDKHRTFAETSEKTAGNTVVPTFYSSL